MTDRSPEFLSRLLAAIRGVQSRADELGIDMPTARMMAYEAWAKTGHGPRGET